MPALEVKAGELTKIVELEFNFILIREREDDVEVEGCQYCP